MKVKEVRPLKGKINNLTATVATAPSIDKEARVTWYNHPESKIKEESAGNSGKARITKNDAPQSENEECFVNKGEPAKSPSKTKENAPSTGSRKTQSNLQSRKILRSTKKKSNNYERTKVHNQRPLHPLFALGNQSKLL